MRNWEVFLILTPWSYSKCKDILRTLHVDKIPAKEHQVVDPKAADKMSILEILFWKYSECPPIILGNYKKLKWRQIVRFTFPSFLSAQ